MKTDFKKLKKVNEIDYSLGQFDKFEPVVEGNAVAHESNSNCQFDCSNPEM